MTYPLIFGEILFDQFPDGDVLGGAPFNVAWHLQGFGLTPKIVSRVGRDPLGEQILAEMQKWRLDDSYVQLDEQRATGTVKITLEQGQPTFDITRDVAYDHINVDKLLSVLKNNPPSLVYHGSLAARHSNSRSALLAIKKSLDSPVFVDINLRKPWYDLDIIEQLLMSTQWLKLNEDELTLLTKQSVHSDAELIDLAQRFRKKYGLTAMIVTLGARGAFIVNDADCYRSEPVPVIEMVDAVGAGDGFSAVTITGLLKGWDFPMILQRATAFAAAICQQRGAINTDRNFYSRQMSEWNS
jgi:fructokinase